MRTHVVAALMLRRRYFAILRQRHTRLMTLALPLRLRHDILLPFFAAFGALRVSPLFIMPARHAIITPYASVAHPCHYDDADFHATHYQSACHADAADISRQHAATLRR